MTATARRYDAVKHGVDVAVSALMLVITAPVQAVVAILVRRDLRRPVLFRQQRPGRGGNPFTLVKFRGTTEGILAIALAVPSGWSVPDAEFDRIEVFIRPEVDST